MVTVMMIAVVMIPFLSMICNVCNDKKNGVNLSKLYTLQQSYPGLLYLHLRMKKCYVSLLGRVRWMAILDQEYGLVAVTSEPGYWVVLK